MSLKTPNLAMETAYPLRTVAAGKLQDEGRRRQQSRWNGNAEGATNDSEEYRAAVKIIDNFPVEYSCLEDPRKNDIEDIDVKELIITFDYEMLTKDSPDPDESVRSLEWSLLWNVASVLGLHNCSYLEQDPLSRRRLPEGSFVVGLSSLDFDEFDDSTKRCTILNDSVDTRTRTLCTPMKGQMTAFYIGDRDIVQAYLKRNIEEEMNSDRVRIETVTDCLYIGERSVGTTPNDQLIEPLDTKHSNTNLALVTVFSIILFGIFMLSFALLMARSRRRREEMMLDDDAPLENPIPAVIFQKTSPGRPARNMQPSISSDTEESVPDRIESQEDDRGRQPISVVAIAAGRTASPMDDVEEQPLGSKEGVISADAETLDSENPDVTHVPPLFVVPVDELPPKETIKSKTLQTRRKRKKKKKKKPVLVRISSKQSINEMETINETDEGVVDGREEGSEFDGSEYSEYSTDDDDDLLLMVNTPVSNDESTSPRISPGAAVPPSPIREEPKIRRLPPPWI